MIVSLRPISFHCSSTACEGLGAGFGGSFFAVSCPSTGNTANPAANANPAAHFSFFIFPLLRYAPRRGGRTFFPSDVPLRPTLSSRPAPRPPQSSIDLHPGTWPSQGGHPSQLNRP